MREVWVKFWTLGAHLHSNIDLGRFAHYMLEKSLPCKKVKGLDLNSDWYRKDIKVTFIIQAEFGVTFQAQIAITKQDLQADLWIRLVETDIWFFHVTIQISDAGPLVKTI